MYYTAVPRKFVIRGLDEIIVNEDTYPQDYVAEIAAARAPLLGFCQNEDCIEVHRNIYTVAKLDGLATQYEARDGMCPCCGGILYHSRAYQRILSPSHAQQKIIDRIYKKRQKAMDEILRILRKQAEKEERDRIAAEEKFNSEWKIKFDEKQGKNKSKPKLYDQRTTLREQNLQRVAYEKAWLKHYLKN